MKTLPTESKDDVTEGMAEVITDQFHARSRGDRGLAIGDGFRVELSEEGFVHVQYGRFRAKVLKANVDDVRQLLSDSESRIVSWDEWAVTKKRLEELAHLKQDLQDELAIITMRRIVPGRCKYCPI